MREQEVRELYEAYMQVHQPQEEVEQLDENVQDVVKGALEKGANFMKTNPVGKVVSSVIAPARKGKGTVTASQQKQKISQNEEVEPDLFDVILEHLIAEGYADTNESALVIMANMSEEWRQSIMEGPGGMKMSPASQGGGQIVKTRREPGPRPSQPVGHKPVGRPAPPPPPGATVTRYDSGGKQYTHIQK